MAKPNQNASLKIVVWPCFCHRSESPIRAFTFKCQFCVVVSCGQSTDKKLRESENPQAHKRTKIFSSFFWPKYTNHFWKKFDFILQKDVVLCNSNSWLWIWLNNIWKHDSTWIPSFLPWIGVHTKLLEPY